MAFTMTTETQSALATLNSGENILLTGKAGTGKSTLLRKYIEDHAGDNILVLAPTGVAALNVEGSTIHRAFGFRPGMYPDDVRGFSNYHPKATIRKVLQTVRTIIIDEISMVRADIFDMMDLALSQIRNVPESFGGVRLILVGDLLQLPPVVTDNEREEFLERWKTPYFFSSHCYPSVNLEQINLQTIWRQSDEQFIEILNQVREGQVSTEALETLNAQVRKTPPAEEGFLTLTSKRSRVSQINQEKIRDLETKILISDAEYEGTTDENSFPGDPTLEYATGARVMTVTNDSTGRFVNGSLGTVIEAGLAEIKVQLDDGPVVALKKHTWEFRRPVVKAGSLSSEIIGTVTQFPIILSWAMTIHKSQGKTIPKCVIDLSHGTTTDGQFYVALSRAVSLENLYFTKPVRRANVLADASLVRRILREGSPDRKPQRIIFLASDHVNFGMSQHVARIHATVIENNVIVADFGSWINPMADLGDLGEKYKIPAGGMAATPTIEQFWPLLLRQAHGALVVGDGLATLERAVRHQARGLKVELGIGYDMHDFDFTPSGDNPVSRCASMTQAYFSEKIDPRRGTEVSALSTDPGALFIPSWATEEVPVLEQSRALPSDLAWAALSGTREINPASELIHDAVQQLADTAAQRGGWNPEFRQDIIDRIQDIDGSIPVLPDIKDTAGHISEFLISGARVAFTGGGIILGKIRSDEELIEICADRGLEFKKGMSESRCDVLIADDISTMSNKGKLAREYGKPIFSTDDFSEWHAGQESSPEIMVASPVSDPTPSASIDVVESEIVHIPPVQSIDQEVAEFTPAESSEVLHAGARVAVTGALTIDGQRYTRGGEIEQLFADLDLEHKSNVSRTRCDVLVADPDAPISGQLRSALEFDKPIVTHSSFATWATQKLAETQKEEVLDEQRSQQLAENLETISPPAALSPTIPAVQLADEETVDAPASFFTIILGGHDFLSSRSQHLSGIIHGKRAEIYRTTEDLRQAVIQELPALEEPASPVVKSLKRGAFALGIAVVISIILSIFSDGDPGGLPITLLAVLMLVVMVGIPIALIRVIYLAFKSRDIKKSVVDGEIENFLGGFPGQQLPVFITGEGHISSPGQNLLQQLCGFHDYVSSRGYPIPPDTWRDLVQESMKSLDAYEHSGHLRPAKDVGQKISDWVGGAEAAANAQQEFRS